MRRMAGLVAAGLALALLPPLVRAAPAQAVQNATLRRAVRAYETLDYRQAITQSQAALRERLSGPERGRAYEILGFAYSGLDSLLKGAEAFRQALLINPELRVDPARTSPRITVAFDLALKQSLLVRELRVDSARLVGGQGTALIRYTVTQPARVRVTAVAGTRTIPIDSGVATGPINLQWPVLLPDGNPLPAGNYTLVVQAAAGTSSFSASQPIRIVRGSVDTLPHLTMLQGYEYLSETETPPRSWRPLGLAFLYTGIAVAGTFALESGDLGDGARRELVAVGAVTLGAGLVNLLRKPAPQPAVANIQYNNLLRDQLARRNAEVARENINRRRQVELQVIPLPKTGAGR
ncbi:MAG: hypothetical protein ACREMR_00310 [Gemmatimonadales bacterium]